MHLITIPKYHYRAVASTIPRSFRHCYHEKNIISLEIIQNIVLYEHRRMYLLKYNLFLTRYLDVMDNFKIT